LINDVSLTSTITDTNGHQKLARNLPNKLIEQTNELSERVNMLNNRQTTERPKRYFKLIMREVNRYQREHPHLSAERAFEEMVHALATRQATH